MKDEDTEGPVDPKIVQEMTALSRTIADMVKPYGFALLIFDFGDSGRMNYMSNANRTDMIKALKELIRNLERSEKIKRRRK